MSSLTHYNSEGPRGNGPPRPGESQFPKFRHGKLEINLVRSSEYEGGSFYCVLITLPGAKLTASRDLIKFFLELPTFLVVWFFR